jgi:hypothetical protein
VFFIKYIPVMFLECNNSAVLEKRVIKQEKVIDENNKNRGGGARGGAVG